MPNSVDEKHSPSDFYYPGETNDPNATFQGEDNAEQNSNKNSQEKMFSGFFYKVRKNCDSTKPYNKSLIIITLAGIVMYFAGYNEQISGLKYIYFSLLP